MTQATTPDPAVRTAILQALDIDVPRPQVSATYRLGLLLVALVMVLLPLIYIAFVLAAAYGVYWHATENLTLFEEVRNKRNAAFAYVTPLVVGVVIVFFMVKPLLAPRPKRQKQFEADPDRQSFLHEFVHKLTAAVGAPAPRRILLDCNANASAGFHQGGLGLTTSGRELTIGLPLVGGMTVRQLAGVLAHEFGHFSQGAAMRLSFVVMTVNSWFARVVFDRDAWDEKLVAWSNADFGYISWPAHIARGCVWLSRKLLHGLMWLGHVVSSNMSRQMEYDADSFEIQLAGTESFNQSMVRVVELSAAQNAAFRNLTESWEQRQLADDFPRLVVQRFDEIDDEVRGKIRGSLDEEETSLFASHPRSIDRMAVADQAASPGAFQVEAPASVLFDEYVETCRAATVSHYESMIGDQFRREFLVSTDSLLADQKQMGEEREVAARFYQGSTNVMCPLPIPADATGDRDALTALRDATVQCGRKLEKALKQLVSVHERLPQNELARVWIRLGLKIDAASFGLSDTTRAATDIREKELLAELDEARAAVEGLLVDPGRRVAVLTAIESEHQEELRELCASARQLGESIPELVLLRGQMTMLSNLLEHEPENDDQKEKMGLAVSANSRLLREKLGEVRGALGEQVYPFEHAEGQVSVSKVAIPSLPKAVDLGELWESSVQADDTLTNLYWRVLCRIGYLGEQVETELGLAPLPEVKSG